MILINVLPKPIKGLMLLISIIGLIVFGIIKSIQFLRKNSFYGKTKMAILSIILILIVAVSWVINMGWFRFIMTILFVPFMHSIAFFLMNLYSAKYFDKSQKIKKLNLFYILTFLIFNIFMPDAADDGVSYFFFGLIHGSALSDIAYFIAIIAAISHVVLFVMQIVEIRKIKKTSSEI